jgi:hypothetical protein
MRANWRIRLFASNRISGPLFSLIEKIPASATVWAATGEKRSRVLDKTVARLNIEHYRRLLANETDESRRQMLLRLLAEEEAKLNDPKPPERKRRPR